MHELLARLLKKGLCTHEIDMSSSIMISIIK